MTDSNDNRKHGGVWRPPLWLSWILLVVLIAWVVAMFTWVQAGIGPWLLYGVAGIAICALGIVRPRR